MIQLENTRKGVLKAIRSYYAHLGYYEELTYTEDANKRELDWRRNPRSEFLIILGR
jgi:hypothetical protein